jgi:hypothetical protein
MFNIEEDIECNMKNKAQPSTKKGKGFQLFMPFFHPERVVEYPCPADLVCKSLPRK